MTMSTDTPSTPSLHLVVGYDGSEPSGRALDAAVRLLHGRPGQLEVRYVAHMPALDMMSADAVAEMQEDLREIEKDLRTAVGVQLQDSEVRWNFEWREGPITDGLLAAAEVVRDAYPGATVVIVVGSSSQAMHRVVGSVAVSLVRRAPVPVIVVP
jgi:nucleotide-binding universal stress UspA family protein